MTDVLNLQIPSPTFGGSTGGWLRAAETEENMLSLGQVKKSRFLRCLLVVLQLCKVEKIFFTLQKKSNVLHLEHNLSNLFKINDYKIYRIFPNSEVQYLHPKDGVFPEKLNEGRIGVGNVGYSIGKNPQPVNVKFTGKRTRLRLKTFVFQFQINKMPIIFNVKKL